MSKNVTALTSRLLLTIGFLLLPAWSQAQGPPPVPRLSPGELEIEVVEEHQDFILSDDTATQEAITLVPVEPVFSGVETALEKPLTGEPLALEEDKNPLFLALVWNHHQPRYFKDPETGSYEEGWVRIHSANAYLPMIKLVKDYPSIKCNFNITPSLMLQMKDIISMYKSDKHSDRRMQVAMKKAESLDNDDTFFLLVRYFDMPQPTMISTSAPYQALLDKRDRFGPADAVTQFSVEELRDLQVWFDLTWTHPMLRKPESSLGRLWDKGLAGKHFDEDDKKNLFDEQISILDSVLNTYREAQEAGQIEVITTPYAHPILPLVYNSDLGKVALSGEPMPKPAFKWPGDASLHVKKAKHLYAEIFGRNPRGMWPGEGSVAQEIIPLVADESFSWFLSDVSVLQRSFGPKELTLEQKYLPYLVSEGDSRLHMLFRDTRLSDRIGFRYSKMAASEAVSDFIGRLREIHDSMPQDRPYIATIVLDGENAWEHYPDRGERFLRELYRRLSIESNWLKTVRISDYLESLPDDFQIPQIEKLWPGSWIDADFHIWIGEEQENKAWKMLQNVREYWQAVLDQGEIAPDVEEAVWNEILAAEGSDWFWWFGYDQESANDSAFDVQFRNTLKNVYRLTGKPDPAFLDEPIVPPSVVVPAEFPEGYASATIDGVANPADEWAAGVSLKPGGAAQTMAAGGNLKEARLAYDRDNLYIMAKMTGTGQETDNRPRGVLTVYVRPETAGTFSKENQLVIEIPAHNPGTFIVQAFPNGVRTEDYRKIYRFIQDIAEFSIPWSAIEAHSYGRVGVSVEWKPEGGESEYLPGPDSSIHYIFPVGEISDTVLVVSQDDPDNDDKGPGTYTYPENQVFSAGVFDLTGFDLLTTEDRVLFRFRMANPISNPWSGPSGFSLQTFDVYLFNPTLTTEPRQTALEGRNFEVAGGWHMALTADGWRTALARATDSQEVEIRAGVRVVVDPLQPAVVLSVPINLIGKIEKKTRILPVILGHDGNAAGRVRSISTRVSEWQFGGRQTTDGATAIDLVLPEQMSQFKILKNSLAVPPLALE